MPRTPCDLKKNSYHCIGNNCPRYGTPNKCPRFPSSYKPRATFRKPSDFKIPAPQPTKTCDGCDDKCEGCPYFNESERLRKAYGVNE